MDSTSSRNYKMLEHKLCAETSCIVLTGLCILFMLDTNLLLLPLLFLAAMGARMHDYAYHRCKIAAILDQLDAS